MGLVHRIESEDRLDRPAARKVGSRDVDLTAPHSSNGAGRTQGTLTGR